MGGREGGREIDKYTNVESERGRDWGKNVRILAMFLPQLYSADRMSLLA